MKLIYILLFIFIFCFIFSFFIPEELEISLSKSLPSFLNPTPSPFTTILGQNPFFQYKTSGDFHYKVLSKTGNESLYDVTFKDVNKTETIICLEAGWDNKQITIYKNENQTIVDKNYTYTVPSTLSFYKTDKLIKQTDLTKTKNSEFPTSASNPNKFCYQANKEKDFYLKFGDNSVTIILEADIVSDSLLTNVTAETGDANFTHLNISTTAPYDNLVGYWSFDGDKEDTLTTTHYDFTKNNNDGTGVGDANVNDTNCLYDDCLHLGGSNDYVMVDDNGDSFGKTVCINGCSFSVWGRSNTSASGALVGRADNADSNWFFLLGVDGSGRVYFNLYSDGGAGSCIHVLPAGDPISLNEWYHFVGVYDNSTGTGNISIYRNGVFKLSTACSFSGINITAWQDDEDVFIGMMDDSGFQRDWKGMIDEVMIFNTSLTQAQISDIYNNQSARFDSSGKQELNNQSYLNLTGNIVNVSTTFNNSFSSNVSLFLQYYRSGSWTSTSTQNITSGQNATFNIGGSNFTNLTLNYTLIAGNDSITPFYTPIVYDDIILGAYAEAVAGDTINPNVTIDLPTNTTYDTSTIIFNVTAIDEANMTIGGCRVSIDGGASNLTMLNTTNVSIYNATNTTVLDGGYQAEFFCNDSVNNMNDTETQDFFVDTTPPAVTIDLPENVTYNTNTIVFNVTSTDLGDMDSCWISIDSGASNLTLTNTTNLSIYNVTNTTVPDGGYQAQFYCNDSVNNVNNTETQDFYVDTVAPVVTIDLPANTTYTSNSIVFNVTATDTVSMTNGGCLVTINLGVTNLTMTNATNVSIYNITNTTVPDGDYNSQFYCNDSANNLNKSQGINFSVDTLPPHLIIKSPLNQSYNTALNFTVNVTDTTNVQACWWTNNAGVSNVTMINDSAYIWNYTAPTVYSDKGYRIQYYCNDTNGLVNNSETVDVLIDTISPNVTINAPTNITYDTNTIVFNVTANETNAVSSCWISIDAGVTNLTLTNTTHNDYYNATNNTVPDGDYQTLAWCNDTTNNLNDTVNVSFLVDTTTPNVTINLPTNTTNNSNSVEFNVTATDTTGMDVCWVTIDAGVTNLSLLNLTTNDNYNATNTTVPDGGYEALFYCNDSINNVNNTENISFFIDATLPSLNITYPINNTDYTDADLDVNYTFIETNCDVVWYTNGTLAENITLASCGTNITDVTWTIGTHNVTIYINDTANNVNQSHVNFTISAADTIAPNVTITTPANTTYTTNTIVFNTTAVDETLMDSCWATIDAGVTNLTLTNTTNVSIYNATNTTVPDGGYEALFYCNDSINNVNNTENNSFLVDTTAPTISNFRFIALNSSEDQIGTDETAFNFSNLEDIEYMNISFELTDSSEIEGDIKIYFTANGTSACSLGNNQSATCYDFYDDEWVEFQNGTDTSTFRGIGGSAQGDSITCDYTVISNGRNYTCEIDEHYNPNVWKHYPLNFSDAKWQGGVSERIKKNTIWKIQLDASNIPLDADEYKIDFRVNASMGSTPTNELVVYLCNSTYTTGDPSDSVVPECQLVGGKLPADFTDDGTKCRDIFTSALTSSLGDIKYVLLTTDSPAAKYYAMRTYGFLGTAAVRTSISTDDGATYTNLSDGYEAELNINWFYDSTSSNITQTLFKIYSNDSLGNDANSSIQAMTWKEGYLNEPPIVDIIIPEISSNNSGVIEINWTTAEPNGETYLSNVTANNGTSTTAIAFNLSNSVSNSTWDTTAVVDGLWNVTVESCENSTSDLYCGNDTHQLTVDNKNPEIVITNPVNLTNLSSTTFDLNYTFVETNPDSCWYSNNSGTANSSVVSMGTNWTDLIGVEGSNNRTVYCNDSANNLNSSIVYFTIDTTYPEITITYPSNNTDYTDTKLDVNYTYVEINCDSVWYSNDSLAANTSLGCGTNITSVTWTIGIHNVTIWINDSVNNVNLTYVNFSISAADTTNPEIAITNPTNLSNLSSATFDLNYTFVEANPDSCWYSNNSGVVNSSIVSMGTNWTGLIGDEGLNNKTLYCNDSTNNQNSTLVGFTIDTTNPAVNITYPTNNTAYANNELPVNFTRSDTNIDSCWYSNDTYVVNTTLADCFVNITGITWIQGQHNVTVWVNDSVNNVNSSIIFFTIDTTNPLIAYDSQTQADQTNISQSNIYVNVTLTETNLENMSYTLYNETLPLGNLVGYWSLDRNLSTQPDLSGEGNDGTVSGAYFNSSGKLNGAYEFDGVDDYITVPYQYSSSIEFTISMWITPKSFQFSGNNSGIFSPTDGGGQNLFNFGGSSGGNGCLLLQFRNDTSVTQSGGSAVSGYCYKIGISDFLVLNYNKTAWNFYVNGILNGTQSLTESYQNIDFIIDHSIGRDFWNVRQYDSFNGSIDEVMIFNTSLTATEISDLYNRSVVNHTTYSTETLAINWTGLSDNEYHYFVDALDVVDNYNSTEIRRITLDTTYPQINITYPTNNTDYTDTNLNVNYTATDTNLDSCWYSNDTMSANTTLTNCINITTVTWIEGQHNLTVWVNDSANNVNSSSVIFTIDITPPSFTDFANQTIADGTALSYDINATDTYTEVDCFTVNDTDFAITCAGVLTNNTDLSAQIYNLNISVNDSLDNLFSDLMWVNVTPVDTTNPEITITNPTNLSNVSSATFDLNYTFVEANPDSCWYSNNSGTTNSSIVTMGTNWTNLIGVEGSNNRTLWCNDTSNNANITYVEFTVDTTYPEITITYPANNTDYTDTGLHINYTFVETNCDSVWYTNDSMAVNTSLGCGTNITTVTWAIGVHNVTIWINDSANNVNLTYVNFSISAADTTNPEIAITNPTNLSNLSSATFDLNYTFVEANPDSCWYSNNSGEANSSIVGMGTNWTDLTGVEGSNNRTVYCNDTSNNFNSSIVYFTIDTTYPQISIASPTNNTNSTNTNLDVNYTSSDTNLDSCWYSNDTLVANTTLTNCANITTITWIEGRHNVTIWVNDSANNVNSSSVIFTIDITPPYFTVFANQTLTNTTALSYDIDAEDDLTEVDCFAVNDTNFSITCAGVLTNSTNFAADIYWINISVNDSLNNLFSDIMFVNYTFVVDTTPPYFVTIANYTNTVNTSFSETIVGADETNFSSYALNDTSIFTIGITSGVITNVTALTNITIYHLNVTINDTSNNINSSVFWINITSVVFSMNISSPTNTTYDTSTISVNLSTTGSPDIYWYSLDSASNVTFTPNTTITGVGWEAWHDLTVYVNDTSGAELSETRRFFIGTEENFWVWFDLFIIFFILLILGTYWKDFFFLFISGCLSLLMGIWVFNDGITVYGVTGWWVYPFAWILTGLGVILAVGSAYEFLEEMEGGG